MNPLAGAPGQTALSSTVQTDDGTFIYITLPIADNKILTLTLSGQYFSQRLSEFNIWETGHIFISDSDGYTIANPREEWVNNRINMITAAECGELMRKKSNCPSIRSKCRETKGIPLNIFSPLTPLPWRTLCDNRTYYFRGLLESYFLSKSVIK